jgi:hypothetical protein
MPQVTIRRPFSEVDLCDQLRLEPDTVFHFFLRFAFSAFLINVFAAPLSRRVKPIHKTGFPQDIITRPAYTTVINSIPLRHLD